MFVPAGTAAQLLGQDAALEESVELILHRLRQVGAGSGFGLGEEGRGVLLHQPVKCGLLGAVSLIVDRGASWRPLGLPVAYLHGATFW